MEKLTLQAPPSSDAEKPEEMDDATEKASPEAPKETIDEAEKPASDLELEGDQDADEEDSEPEQAESEETEEERDEEPDNETDAESEEEQETDEDESENEASNETDQEKRLRQEMEKRIDLADKKITELHKILETRDLNSVSEASVKHASELEDKRDGLTEKLDAGTLRPIDFARQVTPMIEALVKILEAWERTTASQEAKKQAEKEAE